MLRRTARLASALLTTVAALATLVPNVAAEPPPGATYTTSANASTVATAQLAVAGHGWGHGRGMGQYGSLGYATGTGASTTRLGYLQILEHFYGGTTQGHVNDNPLMAVLLKGRSGQPMVIYRAAGLQVPGVTGAPTAIRVTLRPDGQFDVQAATSCVEPGAGEPVQAAGPLRVDPAPDSGDTALRLCNTDGSAVAYRGALVAFGRSFDDSKTGAETINLVHMDELLRGVVPRESPASWGDAAGGAGINALKAQAVAARSYAAAGDSRWGDRHSGLGARATTCDDQFCQVYGGLAAISSSGAVTYKTDPRTDRAIVETTGEIRRTSAGGVARTEFSSSTGGWSAGGTFPAVQDLGDSTPSNPNHAWSATVPATVIAEKFSLGSFQGAEVTARNGLGDQGGRVKTVRLRGTSRTVEVTGNELRSALSANGVKSDWFDITVPPPPAVQPRDIASACPPGEPTPQFSDVPQGNVHRPAIGCLAARGIAAGIGNGRYGPDRDVSRGQMATFLARLITSSGRSLPQSAADSFSDDNGSVHEGNINGLAAAGIAAGTSPGRFSPDRPVSRAQMATFISRTYEYLAERSLPAGDDVFTDDNGSNHEGAINALAAKGVATGTGPGRYAPDLSMHRDQMASLLARTLDLLVDEQVIS